MKFLNALISREPVMTMSVIQAGLALAMAFGFNMTAQQMGSILVFTAAVLGWLTRSKVTPLPAPVIPPKDGGQ